MWLRLIDVALHFAIIGGLADVALLLHDGRTREAIFHAFFACICIVLIAGAGALAKKLLNKQ